MVSKIMPDSNAEAYQNSVRALISIRIRAARARSFTCAPSLRRRAPGCVGSIKNVCVC